MLRLEIDGRWEPEDFIEVLKGVESLYYKATIRGRYPFEPPFYLFDRAFPTTSFDEHVALTNDWLLSRARTVAHAEYRIRVARISYASPGNIDLVGLGEAFKSLEGIIDRLIKLFTERRLRREADKQAQIDTAIGQAELDQAHESVRTLKIDNARRFLELRREFHDVPDDLLVALVASDQDRLIPRIAEGKLIGVRRLDDDSPPKDREAA